MLAAAHVCSQEMDGAKPSKATRHLNSMLARLIHLLSHCRMAITTYTLAAPIQTLRMQTCTLAATNC